MPMVPRVYGSGEQTSRSIPSACSSANAPQTSTSVSSPPSSWRCTSAGSAPWIEASTFAILESASIDRSRTTAGRAAAETIAMSSDAGRPAPGSVSITRTCVAPIAARWTPFGDDPDVVVQIERRDHLVEGGDRGAGIEEGAEEHVARQSADAVEVGDRRHGTAARRAIRAATLPAPRPSSIPTTARPSAHEQSIALSAVRPPSADP